MPLDIRSRKRRRIGPIDSSDANARASPIFIGTALTTPTTSGSTQQVLSIDHIQANRDMPQAISTIHLDEGLPFASHLACIFPPMMLSSIVKREDRAEIEVIHTESPEQSWLRLSIYPHRVPYLAKELFDVDVDVKDTLIHLRLDSGAKAKVLELDGARHETLEKCFGRQVAAAIRSTRKFSTEKRQGEVVTKCVSLKIEKDPCFSCSFSLMLDRGSLSAIVAEIWPPR